MNMQIYIDFENISTLTVDRPIPAHCINDLRMRCEINRKVSFLLFDRHFILLPDEYKIPYKTDEQHHEKTCFAICKQQRRRSA